MQNIFCKTLTSCWSRISPTLGEKFNSGSNMFLFIHLIFFFQFFCLNLILCWENSWFLIINYRMVHWTSLFSSLDAVIKISRKHEKSSWEFDHTWNAQTFRTEHSGLSSTFYLHNKNVCCRIPSTLGKCQSWRVNVLPFDPRLSPMQPPSFSMIIWLPQRIRAAVECSCQACNGWHSCLNNPKWQRRPMGIRVW